MKKKRELFSIFCHWSFSSESKRKLEKFLCEQCINVWREFFSHIFLLIIKKMPRSNWCTTWADIALNIKLSHLQIDLSYKRIYALHCTAPAATEQSLSKLWIYDAWISQTHTHSTFNTHSHDLFSFFLVHSFRILKHCKWGSENPTENKRDEISLCVCVCVTKTFECHHYYYFWPRFHFTIYILRFLYLHPILSALRHCK